MSRPLSPRALTLAPVLERLAGTPCSAHARSGETRCWELGCDTAVAEAVGRSRRVVQRWKHDGITIDMADEIAVALGAHPIELWGSTAWNHAQLVHEAALGREELDA